MSNSGKTENMEYLVSAVNAPDDLPERMHLDADALIVNQTDHYDYGERTCAGHRIRRIDTAERGVGLSRNTALQRGGGDILLFSDEDIVYGDGAAKAVLQAFAEHPEADMLLFNVKVAEQRRTYWTESFHRVGLHNCGRYPAYSFALRRERMQEVNLSFHQWFGGGARYSNGEDSLFISDCIRRGLRVCAVPVCIGEEIPRPSTWFSGYNEKFFYDRGVLYHYLYGALAPLMARRFLLKNRSVMCTDIPYGKALGLMKKGIRREKE